MAGLFERLRGAPAKPAPRKRGPSRPLAERMADAERRERVRQERDWAVSDPAGYAEYLRLQRDAKLEQLRTGRSKDRLDIETVERVVRYLEAVMHLKLVPKGAKVSGGDEVGLADVIELLKASGGIGGILALAGGSAPAPPAAAPPQPQLNPPAPPPPIAAPPAPVPPIVHVPTPPAEPGPEALPAAIGMTVSEGIMAGIAGKTPADAAAWLHAERARQPLIAQFLPRLTRTPDLLLPQLLRALRSLEGWGQLADYLEGHLDWTRATVAELRKLPADPAPAASGPGL